MYNGTKEYKGSEEKIFRFYCECCLTEFVGTPQEAFNLGWDIPPLMYPYKCIAPRTCPSCGIKDTVWWAIVMDKKTPEELSLKQKEILKRILNEPESLKA